MPEVAGKVPSRMLATSLDGMCLRPLRHPVRSIRQPEVTVDTRRHWSGMPTQLPEISEIWQRIKRHDGETFAQIRGGEFRYGVAANSINLDRTNWSIPRSHIEEALTLVPLSNTVPVQHLFAPSYIYAILMDARIRQSDW